MRFSLALALSAAVGNCMGGSAHCREAVGIPVRITMSFRGANAFNKSFNSWKG